MSLALDTVMSKTIMSGEFIAKKNMLANSAILEMWLIVMSRELQCFISTRSHVALSCQKRDRCVMQNFNAIEAWWMFLGRWGIFRRYYSSFHHFSCYFFMRNLYSLKISHSVRQLGSRILNKKMFSIILPPWRQFNR